MDPLTGAAIAVGSIIATKALEKTGEKVVEKVALRYLVWFDREA